MTGHGMRAQAQQPRRDAGAAVRTMSAVGNRIAAVRKALEDMKKIMGSKAVKDSIKAVRDALKELKDMGMPGELTHNSVNSKQELVVSKLLASLAKLNQQLKPYTGGKDFIPISGKNDEEKFRSLMVTLGGKETELLDEAKIKKLEKKLGEDASLVHNSTDSRRVPIVSHLLASLVEFRKRIEPFNPGPDEKVDVTGTTDLQRFRSMNTWLGRDSDAPLDSAALDSLNNELIESSGVLSAEGTRDGVIAAGTPPAPTVTPTPPVRPKITHPKPEAKPKPKPAVKPKPPSPDLLAQRKKEERQNKLKVIMEHHPWDGIRKVATKISDGLKRGTFPEANADRFINSRYADARKERDAAQSKAIDEARLAADVEEPTPDSPEEATQQQMDRILKKIQPHQDEASERRNIAQTIADKWTPRIWGLGKTQWKEMGDHLEAAADAVAEDNPDAAKIHLEKAKRCYEREQKYYAKYLLPYTRALKATENNVRLSARRGTLPDKDALLQAERRDKIGPDHGVDDQSKKFRYYHTLSNGKHNSATEIADSLKDLREFVERYIATHKGDGSDENPGKISWHYIDGLRKSIEARDATANALVSFWGRLKSNESSMSDEQRATSWRAYGAVSAMLTDPGIGIKLSTGEMEKVSTGEEGEEVEYTPFNPYEMLPPEIKKWLFGRWREANNKPDATDEEVEKAIMASSMRAPRWKFDDMIFTLSTSAAGIAPSFAELARGTKMSEAQLKAAVTKMAALESARVIFERDYLPYITEEKENAEHRLEDARIFLKHAIKISLSKTDYVKNFGGIIKGAREKKRLSVAQLASKIGVKAEELEAIEGGRLPAPETARKLEKELGVRILRGRLIKYAQRWLDAYETVAPAKRVQVADTFYQIAMNLVAITDAQMWYMLAAHGVGRASLTEREMKQARSLIRVARKFYMWNFVHPKVSMSYYPILTRAFSDLAVNKLAPRALPITEIPQRYDSKIESERESASPTLNALVDEIVQRDGDPDEEIDEAKRREIILKDMPVFFEIGQKTAEKHIRLLLSLRSDDRFAVPQGQIIAKKDGWAVPYSALHPRVSRSKPITADLSVQEVSDEIGRGRLTVEKPDKHQGKTAKDSYFVHAPLAEYDDGRFLGELIRETGLYYDTLASPLLRQHGDSLKELREGLVEASEGYATGTPESQYKESSKAMLTFLDKRVEELERRLSGDDIYTITDRNNKEHKLTLTQLLDRGRKDPKVNYIKRAIALAQWTRKQHGWLSGDLSMLQVLPPDLVDMAAELAADSISVSTLTKEKWKILPPQEGWFEFADPLNAARLSREEAEGPNNIRAILTSEVMVNTGGGAAPIPLKEYEKANEKQHQLTYHWFVYHKTSVKDEKTGEYVYLLLDPRHLLRRGRVAIGRVMKNVLLPDGRRGDAVVKIKRVKGPLATPLQWDIVKDPKGNPEVLYELRTGTLSPIPGDPALTRGVLAKTAMPTTRDVDYIEMRHRSGYEVVVIPGGRPRPKK